MKESKKMTMPAMLQASYKQFADRRSFGFVGKEMMTYRQLQTEVEAVGFKRGKTLAIEGLGWVAKDFEQRWQDEERRAQLLDLIRKIEEEPSLLGMSGHIMVIAKKV